MGHGRTVHFEKQVCAASGRAEWAGVFKGRGGIVTSAELSRESRLANCRPDDTSQSAAGGEGGGKGGELERDGVRGGEGGGGKG